MTRRPRLLDLYCGAGGAAMGYHRAGFEVIGIDIAPQPHYPFLFVQGDALTFLRRNWNSFDAAHASPPCQKDCTLTAGTNAHRAELHVSLLAETRDALDDTTLPYVIEQPVGGAIMRTDLQLCGLQFGLQVFRHRKFELNRWSAPAPAHPSHKGHRVAGWRHGRRYDGDMIAVYGDGGGKGTIAQWQHAMGIDWVDTRLELAEAIPPAYTEYIGRALLAHLDAEAAA